MSMYKLVKPVYDQETKSYLPPVLTDVNQYYMVIYNTFIECDKSEEISWYAVEDPEGTQTQEEIDFKRKAGQNAQSIRCNNQRLSLENEIPVGE